MSVSDPVVNPGAKTGENQAQDEVTDVISRVVQEPASRFDLTTVLRGVLSQTIALVGAERGFILVLDEGGWPSHWFVLQEGQGMYISPTRARAVVDRGIVGQVIRHRRPDVVDNVAVDPGWLPLAQFPIDADRGSALFMPLFVHRRVVSVLTLTHQQPRFFTSQHVELLQKAFDKVALYIENARLYEMARRRSEEMAALHEMALNISADQPLVRLLDTVVAQAMDLLRCQGGGVFLWRAKENILELVAAYDVEIDLRGLRIAPGKGLVGRVFETGDPLVVDEYGDWPDGPSTAVERGLSSGLPTTAAIAVPLAWQGQRLGVLVGTDRTVGRYFGYRDQHLLTLLANQAAAAIASAQMHEQTSRRLQELNFLNDTIQAITVTLDLDEIFAILTRRIKDLLGIEACSIALVEDDAKELVFLVASGGGADTVVGERVPWGQGIVGVAAETGKPVTVSDVSQDERFYQGIDKKQKEFVTHSILAVPMVSRGKVVGVMEGLNKPGGFDAEDERMLSALASLAASVVENANLISAQRELERLRESLTHMIVHDLRSPVGTISNCLQLLPGVLGESQADQAGQLIEIASRANQRLLNMVDSILDISRLEAGQELTDRRPVLVGRLVRSAVDQLTLYAQRKRMRLKVALPEELPSVLADGEMLERVLVNLINNALKFTPANGEVVVSVEEGEQVLYVRVRDNGPGIAPEHQRRIFDKFARVRDHEGAGGIGLGLAFSRLAVEAHGGRIWVESSPGEGSTFVFTLPFSEERER